MRLVDACKPECKPPAAGKGLKATAGVAWRCCVQAADGDSLANPEDNWPGGGRVETTKAGRLTRPLSTTCLPVPQDER